MNHVLHLLSCTDSECQDQWTQDGYGSVNITENLRPFVTVVGHDSHEILGGYSTPNTTVEVGPRKQVTK